MASATRTVLKSWLPLALAGLVLVTAGCSDSASDAIAPPDRGVVGLAMPTKVGPVDR